jgi:RNA polymerase sigma factor (sigma-70 family)
VTRSKEEFVNILKTHKTILYKITRSYCNDADDRKDLEQEIVIQIWKSLSSYNPDYQLSTWIYRIALNVAISHLRKDTKRKNHFEPAGELLFDLSEDTTEQQIISEQSGILHSFINGLDKLNKALMILYLEGKSHKEIAEVIGISESNVSTKINRIKNLLREKVAQ